MALVQLQAQTLVEASKPPTMPDFKLYDEHMADEEGAAGEGAEPLSDSGEEATLAKAGADKGEPETLDFSPDSFWDVLPDLAPLIASCSGRAPDVRARIPHSMLLLLFLCKSDRSPLV